MTAPKGPTECIFCVAAVSKKPSETLTLFRAPQALVMLNRYPYTNGHLMIAPVRHVAQLYETDGEVLFSLIRLTAECQRILSDVYHPDGFNIGMNLGAAAGAGVADHYHIHVVPRWGGDTNFMSVTSETRVVPEDLGITLKRLQPKFRNLSRALRREHE
ncbi:MAG: HIT domain-containing protein [Thermoanaerobaculia bacterium]